jgi:hypothetical protein
VLLDLLPAAFEPWGSSTWYPSRPPTDLSVQRIESELGIRLPPLFVNIARACPSYGGWFGSIGEDFASHNHIVQINRAFRTEGLDPRYVLLNHGHDGDCDVWDTQPPLAGDGERPIVYFNYDVDRHSTRGFRIIAASFAAYIDAHVRTRAPRCPVKDLRRRAKRMLAGFDVVKEG